MTEEYFMFFVQCLLVLYALLLIPIIFGITVYVIINALEAIDDYKRRKMLNK